MEFFAPPATQTFEFWQLPYLATVACFTCQLLWYLTFTNHAKVLRLLGSPDDKGLEGIARNVVSLSLILGVAGLFLSHPIVPILLLPLLVHSGAPLGAILIGFAFYGTGWIAVLLSFQSLDRSGQSCP